MLKLAKEICELQGIKYQPKIIVIVICPDCDAKKFELDGTGKGKCRNCGHEASIDEIEEIAKDNWCHESEHMKTFNLMTKRGD